MTRSSQRPCAAALVLLLSLVATARAAPPAPASPLTIGDTWLVHSTVLGEDRRINVYVPPGYDKPDAAALPVLYMLDGGLAEDFLHVAGLVQVGVGNGTVRPFLLVGIENTERRRDLVPATEVPEERKIAPHAGGTAAFRRFLRSELMPQIRARYRTTAETAVVGESFAGLFVVETFLYEPDLFDTYIAIDASLWWNRKALLAEAPRALARGERAGKTVFLAASRDDIDDGSARFERLLSEAAPRGVAHSFLPMPQERHATIYHPAALAAFRQVLAPSDATVPATPEQTATSQWMVEQAAAWAAQACHGKWVISDLLADDFQGTAPKGARYGKPSGEPTYDANTQWSTDCRLDEATVRFFTPDAAVMYGAESKTVTLPTGGTERRCLVWTDTWLRRAGRWQIVAVQDTRVECPAATKSPTP